MARVCELTGKRFMVGNTVSHSKRRGRRKYLPNIHVRRLFSEVFNMTFPLKVSNSSVRTVELKNGLDQYLLGHNNLKAKEKFSLRVLRLYKLLKKKVAQRLEEAQA